MQNIPVLMMRVVVFWFIDRLMYEQSETVNIEHLATLGVVEAYLRINKFSSPSVRFGRLQGLLCDLVDDVAPSGDPIPEKAGNDSPFDGTVAHSMFDHQTKVSGPGRIRTDDGRIMSALL